jgi:serine/arginine repetitive matrix protein 2
LEKQKQREEEIMEMEKKRQREREEERQRDREQYGRKGGNDVERDNKRKLIDDRYDPNSSRVREGYKDRQNRDGNRWQEEHGRHSRYMDSHDSKRSRRDDDSHYHSRRDYEQRYSRDEHRDRRRH